ncbi:hypothetical protein O3P69_004583 [Scylla paramamosain]|uniref:Uncharacterized protein n=1 Tax=Scylla paramamosain TaxID=85552 RepID=A0AAW0UGS2_SCYPA
MESRAIIPPTLPTFGHATVYVYPTVAPRVVVVPIITCIIGFPCPGDARDLRPQNAHSVESSASALELTSGSSILASRCTNGKAHRLKKRKKALVRFKPMPEIDLDTVVEEKSEFDAEVTASDLLTTPEELVIPEETTPPASFRAFRYMGAVSQPLAAISPNKTSPFRSQHLDQVAEELELCEDVMLEVSDDEQLDEFDEDEEDEEDEEDDLELDLDAIEVEGVCLEVEEGEDQMEDSDNGTLGTCFTLSPKSSTKSPTGVQLALKKLDGAIKRRHSSPVKVNYGKNRGHQQRSSAKANYTHPQVKEEENALKPPPLKYDIDYIDRELMPRFSPRRSHSVKYTMSRRATSFTGKKRHGESFKLRSKSFSRSISHVHDGPDGRPRGQPRSASTSQEFHNGVMECDVHIVNEYGAEMSSSSCSDRCISGGTSTKSVSDGDTFLNGSETDWSVSSRECHNPVRATVSLPIRTSRKDSDSPVKRKGERMAAKTSSRVWRARTRSGALWSDSVARHQAALGHECCDGFYGVKGRTYPRRCEPQLPGYVQLLDLGQYSLSLTRAPRLGPTYRFLKLFAMNINVCCNYV